MLQVRLISVTWDDVYFYFCSNYSTFFVPDEKSWKAEAEIDMELFHQVDPWVVFMYPHNTVPQYIEAGNLDWCGALDVITLDGCLFKGLSRLIVFWPKYNCSQMPMCVCLNSPG